MVIVFGSLNVDLVVRAPRLPRPGETLAGTAFERVPGGKGANQAVAAARMGARVALAGRVGVDADGELLLAGLAAEGIDTTRVAQDRGAPTGIASIVVADDGSNQIVVVPGANGRVTEADAEALAPLLGPGSVLMLQQEIPPGAVHRAARIARERGAFVVLDPAPAEGPLEPELLALVDLLTPNESEAAALTGRPVTTPAEARAAARHLAARGARNVVVTCGAHGAIAVLDHVDADVPPFSVQAVDSVAAGDAFNGAVAAAFAEGRRLADALSLGAAAGALACTRHGAQPSLPRRDEVLALLSRRS